MKLTPQQFGFCRSWVRKTGDYSNYFNNPRFIESFKEKFPET